MKEESIQKWWLSLDKELDKEAQLAFEQSLKEEPAQELAFEQAKELHEGLQQLEADEPSMRFNKNVLENLPQLYRKISIEPLFTPKVLGRIVLLVIIMILISLIPAFLIKGGGETSYSNLLANFFQTSLDLPLNWMLMLAVLGFGFIAYVWLDRQLNKRFLKGNK